MELTIFQQLILGIIQGVAEWLPISSSGMTVLVMSNFFNITDFESLITSSLFLHLGTFLAALIYLRKDVCELIKSIFNYKKSDDETKKILIFIIISTLISGAIGFLILNLFYAFESSLNLSGKAITFFVSVFLLFTGLSQIAKKKQGVKDEKELKAGDGIILGIAQGLSSIPGVSRSGITVSALLLRKFNDSSALRLSFLMSIPIVLIANIFLNMGDFVFTANSAYGLLTSFAFGIATIHWLIKLSKKINFGWFALIFGLLMIISLLI